MVPFVAGRLSLNKRPEASLCNVGPINAARELRVSKVESWWRFKDKATAESGDLEILYTSKNAHFTLNFAVFKIV